MSAQELSGGEIGWPRFVAEPTMGAEIFDLASHARARAALDSGLSITGIGFNIFVVGEDRSARMTATLNYLAEAVAKRPAPDDWVYLNNFRHPERPTPLALPAGTGRKLCDAARALVAGLREALTASFSGEAYQARLLALREQAQKDVSADMATLAQLADAHGLRLASGEDGALRLLRAESKSPTLTLDPETEREMATALTRVQTEAVAARAKLTAQIQVLNRGIAEEVAAPALAALTRQFAAFPRIGRWLTAMQLDIVDVPERFQLQPGMGNDAELPERRYAINLLVDHGDDDHPLVVLENNPSYENLFGRIEYHQAKGSVETDFLQIKAGALHRANGGVLVLRAEALAANATVWAFLKAALRDREIRLEESGRDLGQPIAGAPKPRPVPLDLKVVLVGAPHWYATFFESDPDFRTYFKISADIDPDLPADAGNLGLYAGLVTQMAADQKLDGVAPGAMTRLFGIAARWGERRDRLTARVELVEDVVAEAAALARAAKHKIISEDDVKSAYETRHRRNARIEERMLANIVDGMMLIDTAGSAIGQINALTVHAAGDHEFGTPVRVTARAFAGRGGVVNIERDIGMGGPIQQKGAMVIGGYLAGRLATLRPLSFTSTITFEQVYGGVEGDSASMAELIAIISDLAQLPIRQDLAITGSVNQEGQSQPIGGGHWKIEGFFRLCAAKPGGLTGTQGVIVPQSNRINLVLHDEVADAVAAGRFHIWSVATVEDAAALLMGTEVGQADAAGKFPPNSIFGRIAARLDVFDRVLAERAPN
jgi:predicted ATP-dependent protease